MKSPDAVSPLFPEKDGMNPSTLGRRPLQAQAALPIPQSAFRIPKSKGEDLW